MKSVEIVRCGWCGDNELYMEYHDKEWGVPLHDDLELFELLTLEGAQAGLSWLTVLKRRDSYREAFDGFDPHRVAGFNEARTTGLLEDPGIIRNRLKVTSTIKNAKAVIILQDEFGSFDKYIWQFVNSKTRQHHIATLAEIPAVDDEAIRMSKDMKKRGFSFVGPTICYAFMQASGMVNDHLISCFRYPEVKRLT